MSAAGDRADVIFAFIAAEQSPPLQLSSLKPFEAVAQGRLLVANDVGGHKQLILGGETGALFQPGTADALGTAVLGLLDLHEDWPALRAAGRGFVEMARNCARRVAGCRHAYEPLAKHAMAHA